MILPYRTRSFLKRLGIFLAVVIALLAVAWLLYMAWLSRFVLYTRAGVRLDFSQSSQTLSGITATRPEQEDPITIYYNEGQNAVDTSTELTKLDGYYITGAELEKDLEAVRRQVKALPSGTPIMLDLKSIYGNFFYSSSVNGNRNTDVDIEAMDQFIRELNSSSYYTIARIPALRDRLYGLENVRDGLPVAAGYLWMDSYGCYWLNPASDGTVSFLAQIANELRGLGFDEVVFCDYYFPETDKIVFRASKQEALEKAAQTLVNTCATDRFAVSFTATTTFTAPTGRSRIFLQNVAAADAAQRAAQFALEDPAVGVVFMTDIHDTRFEEFGVLRPIADAETGG